MGITGIHSELHSYSNAYINRAGLTCLLVFLAFEGDEGIKILSTIEGSLTIPTTGVKRV